MKNEFLSQKSKVKGQRSKIILICAILILCSVACRRDDPNEPMNPDMAKSMIKLKDYAVDAKGLFQAIKNNDVIILNAFFDAGVDPNSQNDSGETALNFAIQNAETKTVKVLMEKANINLQDKNSNSPLHLALQKNKDEIFNALMEKGADVNVTGRDKTVTNQSVLYLAIIRGREDIAQQVIAKGADPNIADSEGSIPLAEACVGATVKPEVVKMLLDAGAKPNVQEKKGSTPLIYVAANKDISSGKRQEVIKMLLEKGADKSIKESTGKTALDWAKQNGNKDAVDLLK